MKPCRISGLAAAVLLATASVALAADPPLPDNQARMQWWREARFGMFIHWGVYAVPAGNYCGKPVGGIGEWIMRGAKIPVTEYRAFAKHFNPIHYKPEAWAALAKEAGVKYVIITGKHHDGFALFDSKVTDWDVVDATPYKKDLLAPLARAARKRGLKFGLYYSQAQDWVHRGGAKFDTKDGDGWDDAHKGSFDEYLKAIAVPQVEEILIRFQPDVLWWDTPVLMNNERAAPFLPLLAAHPGLIMNNRLGGDNPGDTDTPEQHIPATGMPGRDFETCMTMNDTWGYKSDDHNWKSSADLIRKLSDIASKGGNFLLNVGPTAEGDIPAASVERLKRIGQWMKVNGEAIYGTTASPFAKLPWGRSTTKARKDGTTLYLHVFDWPAGGQLLAPGLHSSIKRATLLAGKRRLTARAVPGGVTIDVPPEAPDEIVSVIKLELAGPLDVTPILPRQASDGSVALGAIDADIHNVMGTDARIEGNHGATFIGNWTDARASVSWRFTLDRPGTFDIVAELASVGASTVQMAVGTQKVDGRTAATGGLGTFATVKLGRVVIPAAGDQELLLKPPAKGWSAANLRSLILKPSL